MRSNWVNKITGEMCKWNVDTITSFIMTGRADQYVYRSLLSSTTGLQVCAASS